MTSTLSCYTKIFGQPFGWTVLYCLCCGPAWGFGLGDLRVKSVAGEPLRAEIRLIAARPGDVDGARAALANRAAFERAGLAHSPELETLIFRAVERGDGSAVIEVTSEEPLTATILHFLLEVQWSRGRLQREYLLTLESPFADEPSEVPQIPVSEPEPAPVESTTVGAAPTLVPDEKPATYTTVANDMLADIARKTMPSADINIEQMMLAMLRLNPEAFVGNNINDLHKGAMLRIPDLTEITRISQDEALAEAARQYAEWKRFRDGFAEQQPETAPQTEVAPPNPEPSQPVPVAQAQGPPDGRLEIVTAEQNEDVPESNSASGGAEDAGLRTELALARERALTQAKQMEALELQLRRTQERMQQNERLITLQAEQLAALQQQKAAPKEDAAITPQPEPKQMQLADVTAELLSGKWQWLLAAVLLLLCLYLVMLIWRTARTPVVNRSPAGGGADVIDDAFDEIVSKH